MKQDLTKVKAELDRLKVIVKPYNDKKKQP